jgi:hypothetical protein
MNKGIDHEKAMMKKVRIVAVFTDKSKLSGDIWIHKNSRLSDALNNSKGDFIPVSNVTYENKELDTFIIHKNDLRGFVPIE